MASPFRYLTSASEVIRLVVIICAKYPHSLRNVEDLLFERGIDVCHGTVRFGHCLSNRTWIANGLRRWKPRISGVGFSGSRGRFGSRSRIAVSARVISTLAKCWPTYTCGPAPKGTARIFRLRKMSNRSGYRYFSGSRLAEP